MQLNTLGTLELPGGAVSEEKPLLLLAYLAHQASDSWLQSEEVASLIWPDAKNALHNLNQAVHTLYKRAGAQQHIERKSGGVTVTGVDTDAQALFEACARRDIADVKRLYRGQFLQSINPDQNRELYETWILPEQEKLQSAVWNAYLDASSARPDNVSERLDEAYALTGVLPEPGSEDFIRCVCLQRLFGEKGSRVERLLQQEISDLGITTLPATDEAARLCLGLPAEDAPPVSNVPENAPAPRALPASGAQLGDLRMPPTRRFGLAGLVAAVALLTVGFGLWRAGSEAGSTEGQVVSTASTPLDDKTPLDIPVAEKLLEQATEAEDPRLALLLAAEAAHGLQAVAEGADATEALRELLLRATEPWRTELEHNVLYLNFSPDGRWLVVAGEDPVVQLWDMYDPAEPYALLEHGDTISEAIFTRTGDYLMTGSGDAKARLWDMRDLGEPARVFEHESRVIKMAESPDGRWLATGTLDGVTRLWSLKNPDAPATVLGEHVGWATSLAFSPDSSLLLTGGDQRGVVLYRLDGDEASPVAETVPLLEAGTIRFGQDQPLAISPDGKWAAAGRPDSAIHLFDLSEPETGQTILQGHRDHVQSLLFSEDSSWLASGSRDGDVRIWDMTQGGAEAYVLEGHEHWVMTLKLSEDGRYLFSGSDDATVRVWDMAVSPPEARVFSDHPHQVRAVALNGEAWMATGSYEGDVLVQNLERSRQDLTQASAPELLGAACRVAGRDFTKEEWERFVGETPYRPLCS